MKISVVIATHGRCKELKEALRSVLVQETDATFDYEVIVVENNLTQESRSIIESCYLEFKSSGRDIVAVKYIHQPVVGKSHAINKGIKVAKGEIIAFTDDDVVADPRWLINLMGCFRVYQCDGVGGRVLPIYPEGTAQWIKDNAIKLAGAVVIYDYKEETKPLDASMCPFIGANYAFLRQVFEENGSLRVDLGPGMVPVMGEDTEFVQRLLARGKKLIYCPQAVVWHPFNPKRLVLKHMAAWHISLGKFDAQREIQKGEKFVYCFGIPRYLLLGILQDFLNLAFKCGNRIEFLNAWRGFFRKAGMIQEYRKLSKEEIITNGQVLLDH